jgi:hypothetical protein
LSLQIWSCKTKKQITTTEINKESAQYIVQQTVSNNLNYTYFSAKFNSDITMPERSISSPGAIRIKKDSIIWISLMPAMGIEMAKVVITKDSIKILNRLEKSYMAGGFGFIKSKLNIDLTYNAIQSLLTNELFSVTESADYNSYISSKDSLGYVIQNISDEILKNNIQINADFKFQQICFTPDSFKITKNFIDEPKAQRSIAVNYAEFIIVAGKQFPEKVNLSATNQEKQFGLSIKYSKINTEKQVSFPFTIPENYERKLY